MKAELKNYLNNHCTPEEFRELAEWMSRKENDSALRELLRPYWNQFNAEESLRPANRQLWEEIRNAIEMEKRKNEIRRKKLNSWFLRIAALLVIALLAGNLLMLTQKTPESTVVQSQALSVPNGARMHTTLPDGSSVWLNSGATLTFLSAFGDRREVDLSGEAYFDVIKSDKPFIVVTSRGRVEVTGTAFNVRSLKGEKRFEATVEEGTVKVTFPDMGESAVVSRGTQAKFENGQLTLSKVETDIYTSWKDGKIIFRHEYLPVVAKRLEQWYNVKIELAADPRLAKIHYTGTLEMESLSEVLELLKVTASIQYTYDNKTRIIRIRHR